MKRFFHTLLLLFSISMAGAQAPDKFAFQGVARGESGQALSAGTAIQVRFTIHKGLPDGSDVYREVHQTNTTGSGIFNVTICSGTVEKGTFGSIAWAGGAYYLHIELAVAGDAYVDLGTTQFMSVPYALHSETSKNWLQNSPIVQSGLLTDSPLPYVGSGSRLIWHPGKAAFRAGYLADDIWETQNIGKFSFAGGSGKATGDYSVAFGESSAQAGYAAALGFKSEALGNSSLAGGSSTKAMGNFATALGFETKAQGSHTFATGSKTEAISAGAVAIGEQTKAQGINSMAAGLLTNAFGKSSVAFGNGSQAFGEASFASGDGVVAKAFGGVTLGTYNNVQDNNVVGTKDGAAGQDRIFQIGNGSHDQALSNALTVLRNGRVGIGNSSLYPSHILDVSDRIRLRHSGATAGIYFDNSQHNSTGFAGMMNDNNIGLYLNNKWCLYVSTTQATVEGNLNVIGEIFDTSDRRKKKDFNPVSNSLSDLGKLKGYRYHWHHESSNDPLHTGLIAQEVEEIFPELVQTDSEGLKSVNYIGLIPHMIESIKELQNQFSQLKGNHSSLSAENDQLKAKLQGLETVK